jgi:cyclopropane-fatty-acyl-phospholipid synthase
VHVTGLTLSRHQLQYVQEEFVKKEGLDADLIYTDFFEYQPAEQFDAIVALGVIEELADYQGIVQRVARWLKPGKRVYLDFMAMTQQAGTFPAFISKYIYQGRTRRVYLPEFVEAVTNSPLEIAAIHNDRRNYYLTVSRWFERFEENKQAIREKFGERMYRLFRMYMAGNPGMLSHPSYLTTAYRVFLELPVERAMSAGSHRS